jgi:hypothetical protein
MTEGFANTFDYGFRSLLSSQGRTLRKMSKRELNLAGEGLELTLGLRALQFVDSGDMFGKRFMFERQMHNAQGAFFILNGLHYWNNTMKQFAGTVTSARILDASFASANGTATASMKSKLSRSFIDEDMAKEIAEMTEQFGERVKIRNGKDMWMPNTERWTNKEAAKHFRASLATDVNRTIVTPGAGDRAVWTSTEFGSMVAQFKSFGQASMQRVLISGMQEGGAAFYYGGASLIGMGMIVNEIKRAQYNIPGEESLKGKIVEGIDRSGILAWFMDVNNSIEVLTDNGFGIRPLLNESPPYSPNLRKIAGSTVGPTGSQLVNAGSLLGDLATFDVNRHTKRKAERMIPLNNHPLVDLMQNIN